MSYIFFLDHRPRTYLSIYNRILFLTTQHTTKSKINTRSRCVFFFLAIHRNTNLFRISKHFFAQHLQAYQRVSKTNMHSQTNSTFRLMALPIELQIMIFTNLDAFDLMAIGRTNKHFSKIMEVHGSAIVKRIIRSECAIPAPPLVNHKIDASATPQYQALRTILATAQELINNNFFSEDTHRYRALFLDNPRCDFRLAPGIDAAGFEVTDAEIRALARKPTVCKLHCFKIILFRFGQEVWHCRNQSLSRYTNFTTEELIISIWERAQLSRVYWHRQAECLGDGSEMDELMEGLSGLQPQTLQKIQEGHPMGFINAKCLGHQRYYG